MRTAILGTFTYFGFAAALLGLLPVVAASRLRHRDAAVPRLPGRWVRRVGVASTALTPLWRFSVEGSAPADIATCGYVVVANHESQIDPFLLSYVPWDMRWVAKAELFRRPFAGWLLSLGGDIPIARGNKESVLEMLAACRATLAQGLSVMIFPEGTRSRDGALLPFKDGAFQLAIDTGRPVLPIALAGTRRCRPKGSFWFGEAEAVAKVLAPIDPKDFHGPSAVEDLRDATRAAIVLGVQELERRLGFAPVAPMPQARDAVPAIVT